MILSDRTKIIAPAYALAVGLVVTGFWLGTAIWRLSEAVTLLRADVQMMKSETWSVADMEKWGAASERKIKAAGLPTYEAPDANQIANERRERGQ